MHNICLLPPMVICKNFNLGSSGILRIIYIRSLVTSSLEISDKPKFYNQNKILLMLFPQKVVDSFNGIKRTNRNFYKDCIPIAHSTIP